MSGRPLNNPKFIALAGVLLYLVGVIGFVGSVFTILRNADPTYFALLGAISVCLLFALKVRAMEIRKMLNSH
jgi:hypothetical protein